MVFYSLPTLWTLDCVLQRRKSDNMARLSTLKKIRMNWVDMKNALKTTLVATDK